jgi:hypothetical protein
VCKLTATPPGAQEQKMKIEYAGFTIQLHAIEGTVYGRENARFLTIYEKGRMIAAAKRPGGQDGVWVF